MISMMILTFINSCLGMSLMREAAGMEWEAQMIGWSCRNRGKRRGRLTPKPAKAGNSGTV